MTVKTRAELLADLVLYLADNNSSDISPEDVRQRFIDLLDSGPLGAVGGNDNRLLRSDGAGGGQIQGSAIEVDDSGHIAAFGGRIKFPASQSASGDANTLDDYEEATFAPVLAFGGASTGITYAAGGQAGACVKIGKLVTGWVYLKLTSKGSATGTATISGLPYTADTAVAFYGGNGPYAGNMTSVSGALGCAVVAGTSTLSLYNMPSAVLNNANFQNASEVLFCFSYRADN